MSMLVVVFPTNPTTAAVCAGRQGEDGKDGNDGEGQVRRRLRWYGAIPTMYSASLTRIHQPVITAKKRQTPLR